MYIGVSAKLHVHILYIYTYIYLSLSPQCHLGATRHAPGRISCPSLARVFGACKGMRQGLAALADRICAVFVPNDEKTMQIPEQHVECRFCMMHYAACR